MDRPKLSLIICVLIFIAVASLAKAESAPIAKIHAPAVTNEGVGVLTELEIELIPGKGRILLNTEPFAGIQTQNSERVAYSVAQNFTGVNLSNKDVIITFRASASIVDGGSAGAAMTSLLISLLENNPLRNDTSMTGTIQPDGSIGPVGSILEKAQAVAESGYKYFLIPKGQEMQAKMIEKETNQLPGLTNVKSVVEYTNITRYAKENWNLTVLQVSNIREVDDFMIGLKNITVSEISEEGAKLPVSSTAQSTEIFAKVAETGIDDASKSLSKAEAQFAAGNFKSEYIEGIIEALKQSESEYKSAQKALKLNYLYGAANHAFRSWVFSQTAMEVMDFSSLEKDSDRKNFLDELSKEAFDNLTEAKKKLSDIQFYANDTGAYEWVSASQNRLAQAEVQYESLNSTADMFYAVALVKAWSNIASSLYDIAKESQSYKVFDSSIFKEESRASLLTVGKIIAGYTAEPPQGSAWLEKTAQKEFSNGWHIAAYIDSELVHTRIEAQRDLSTKTFENYADYVQSRISRVNEGNSPWAKLYKDQAILNLYYAKRDNDFSALNSALIFANEAKIYSDLESRIKAMPAESRRTLSFYTNAMLLIAFVTAAALLLVYYRFAYKNIKPVPRRL